MIPLENIGLLLWDTRHRLPNGYIRFSSAIIHSLAEQYFTQQCFQILVHELDARFQLLHRQSLFFFADPRREIVVGSFALVDPEPLVCSLNFTLYLGDTVCTSRYANCVDVNFLRARSRIGALSSCRQAGVLFQSAAEQRQDSRFLV